jgi:PAS domain S-box-containing protein
LGLEAVIAQMPVAVMVVEAGSLRVVEFNDVAREMSERTLGGVVPGRLGDEWELFHPDGRPYVTEDWPLMRSIASGEVVTGEEYFNVLADGSRLTIRCSSSPILDDQGEIVAGVLVMEDITEQRRDDEERAYHASLLANVEDGVIATDADEFRVTAWNRGAERLYGFTAREALGRPAREVASDPDDEARLKLERELLETGRTRIEFTARRKDGTPVEVELIAVAVKDEQGETSGYLGIHRDVSAHKRDEHALRQANARIVSSLESSTDEFVALDEQWRYTYVNRRALKAINSALGTNLTGEDLMGKPLSDLFPSFVDTALHTELEHGRREGRAVSVEAYSEPSDRWIEVRAFPWNGGQAAYTRDITERRRVEERLEEAREAERSRIARALHDEALQALGEAVALAIAARSAAPEPGPAGRLVAALQRVGEQVRSAIYDLRLGVEQDKPFPDLLQELIAVHREMAGGSEIELVLGDGVPASLGAGGVEVVRIVGEALTNARRHADARHIRVQVRGAAGSLSVEVVDDGRGFDLTRPTSAVHRGIEGMRERAELLHGHLEVRSEPGAGTTVRLEVSVTNGTSGRV